MLIKMIMMKMLIIRHNGFWYSKLYRYFPHMACLIPVHSPGRISHSWSPSSLIFLASLEPPCHLARRPSLGWSFRPPGLNSGWYFFMVSREKWHRGPGGRKVKDSGGRKVKCPLSSSERGLKRHSKLRLKSQLKKSLVFPRLELRNDLYGFGLK